MNSTIDLKREWHGWLEEYKEIPSADDIPSELSQKLRSLLLRCVEQGHVDILKEAYEKVPLARRAAINDSCQTALHLAVENGYRIAVKQMLESVDPDDLQIADENGETALHFAIRNVMPELCKRMLEICPKLANTQDPDGSMPLILAADYGLEDLCIHMIERSYVDNLLIFVQNSHKRTALHIALFKGLEKLCILLIERASADDLLLQDEEDYTALHMAIKYKLVELCKRMLAISPKLGNTQTKVGTTPLIFAVYYDLEDLCIHMIESSYVEHSFIFIQNRTHHTALNQAVLKGMKKLFRLLIHRATRNDLLPTDSDILHLAILAENFEMAHQALQVHPFLGKERNLEDERPLDILTRKASSVMSRRAPLGSIDRLIYSCIPDADLGRASYDEGDFCKEESKMCHITFKSLLKFDVALDNHEGVQKQEPWLRKMFYKFLTIMLGLKFMHKNRQPRDEENPAMHNDVALDNHEGVQKQEPWLRKMFYKFLAITLVEHVKRIRMKKQQYLLICDLVYKLASLEESSLLTVAELGMTEVVKKIMNENPLAIHQRKAPEGKNAVLVAAENRRLDVLELLLDRCRKNKYHLNVGGEVDINGNNVLHLVAKFNRNRRPWGMPGSDMQMHWEMKWYKYVRDSIPNNLSTALNSDGYTPAELFKKEHRDLYQSNGKGEWLRITSQACSVVAALIATVAFNSATTIPGSNNEKGYPNFSGRPALSTFVISAFIALCLSLVSLIIFLSILISPFDDLNDDLSDDNSKSLPKELMGGLTTLFLSIVAMLVSFCVRHYFYLRHTIRFVAIPLYVIGCLIIAYFFFKKVYSIFLFYAVTRKPEPWYEISK